MKKTKVLACGLLMSFCLTIGAPAYAADTTAENASATFNMQQVQDLVIKKNSSNKTLQLSIDALKIKRASINDTKDLANGQSGNAAYFREQMSKAEASGNNANYQYWAELYEAAVSAAGNIDTDELKYSLDSIDDSLDDTKKSASDLKVDLALTASVMYTSILEQQQNIDTLQANLDLLLKQREIAQLRIDNGMATSSDYEDANINTTTLASNLTQAKIALTDTKRTLNDMMGRDLNAPIELAPFEVDETIYPAPIVNSETVSQATEDSYTIYQLKREIDNLKVKAKETDDSTTKKDYANQIAQKELELSQSKTNVDTTLKAKADAITNKGNVYRTAMAAYNKAVTDADYAKMKLDLGMISQLEYQQQEATLLEKKAAQTTAAYNYYFARLEYDYYKNGVSLTNYNQVKSLV